MIQWLQAPQTHALASLIECYWLIEKKIDSQAVPFPVLNPDPCAHLIISPETQPFSYHNSEGSVKGFGSHIIFPHIRSFCLDHTRSFIHLGIKFKIGALYALEIPGCTHPMLDHVEPMAPSRLTKNNTLDLPTLLSVARETPDACCHMLDSFLLPWLQGANIDRPVTLTAKAVELLETTPISELNKKVFCTQRTLERTFNKVTGMTLKQCQSMIKLDTLLEYLHQTDRSNIDWSEVAYQFGFSDQPHLIRYLKSQIGLTPNAYAKERNLTIDTYGSFNQFT